MEDLPENKDITEEIIKVEDKDFTEEIMKVEEFTLELLL